MSSPFKEIENDKVALAYSKIQEKISNVSGSEAYYAVLSLNKLVSTSLRSKKPCSSSCSVIYNLAKLCCNVSSMWSHDQTGCMQCVYHIMRYLLSQKEPLLARKLCGYFFLHCTKDKTRTWAEKEYLVLQNTITYFCYYLYDVNKELIDDSGSKANPFVSWFKFMLRINDFCDFTNTSDFFQLSYSLLRRSQSSNNHTTHAHVVSGLMEEFSHHLRKLVKDKRTWSPKIEMIVFCTNIVSDVLCYFEKDKSNLSLTFAPKMLDFIQSMKTILHFYPINGVNTDDIDLIKLIISLFVSEKEEEFISDFELFYQSIQSKENICVEVYPLIYNSLSTLRSKIVKPLTVRNERVVNLVKLVYEMYERTKEKLKELSTGKGSTLLHAFTAAMYFLHTARLDADSLKELFKTVRLFFHEFNYMVTNLPQGLTVFECGVSYCVNIIQSYKDAELYKEMATLSKSLIKYILMLSPKFIPVDRFKVKLEHLLNNFVTSYGKIGLSYEAQIALLAFVGVHPQFTDVVFKYWAELKVNSPDFNLQKNATSYDIISTSKKDMEDKWPPCSVDSINIEKCLLEEIKAYAKHRDLQIGPVVAVYRVAVKLIKDKLILSQILSAAVDCVSSDEYVSTLNNFQLSLENVLGSLSRLKDNTNDEQILCQINCFIGDIVYQQVRCDIAQLRKKAEYELELLHVPAKENIPVVEGEANNFTPAYSCLKLDVQHSMAEKMSKVLDFWTKAAINVTPKDEQYFSLRYLKGLAYIFRLYDNKTQEVETWKLVYRLSREFTNAKYKVLAVSELLGLIHHVDPLWVEDAQETIQKNDYIRKTYVHTLFFINLAKNFFLNKNFSEAIKLANEVDGDSLKRYHLLNGQHTILIFFIKVHQVEPTPSRSETVFLTLIKSFECLLYSVKNKTWRTFSEKCVLQWLLLEISLILGKTYLDLRMMRHARCYTKKQLAAAQCLALPSRVCEFLTVLSLTDLLTGNSVEAAEKLNGLDTILGLDQISLSDSDNDDFGLFGKTSAESDINSPEFLSHKRDCSCATCSSTYLLSLILNAFTLKTIYTSSGGAKDLARHISKIGKQIISFTDEKENSAPQGLLHYYIDSKVRFYINLSYAHAVWGELEEALKWNRHAWEIQKSNESDSLLTKEINVQFASLNWYFYKPPPTIKYNPKLYDEDKIPIENARTPEQRKPMSVLTKHLKKAVSPNSCAKLPISPRPSNARKVIFDEFDKDLDVEGKYRKSDKENIGSPETNLPSKNISARSPLVQVLPASPKLALRKNLFTEEVNNTGQLTPRAHLEWDVETPRPAMKTGKTPGVLTRTRRAQTEKKTGKKALNPDVLSTPFTTLKKPEIKVFCDDDNSNLLAKSVNTRGRKKGATTTKKAAPKTEKKAAPKALTGRKLTFDSDSDGESHLRKRTGGRPKELGRRLFEDVEESERSVGETATCSWASDESGIVEPSFIEQDTMPLLLTPLEDSMKKLTLSGKKLLPLSTKRMTKLKSLDQTPTSSFLSTRSTSRLNGRSARE